jgi:hypothetical protein
MAIVPYSPSDRRVGRLSQKKGDVKIVYGWHYVRESTIKLSPINPVYYVPSPTNPPTYELIEHRGKWTVTLLSDARPELITDVKTYEEAKQRMCEHAARRALTFSLTRKTRKRKKDLA